jgi:hypothetical protein
MYLLPTTTVLPQEISQYKAGLITLDQVQVQSPKKEEPKPLVDDVAVDASTSKPVNGQVTEPKPVVDDDAVDASTSETDTSQTTEPDAQDEVDQASAVEEAEGEVVTAE